MKHNKNKRKINYILSNSGYVYAMIGGLIALIIIFLGLLSDGKFAWSDIFELKTFISIVLAFALNAVVRLITRFFHKKTEDESKLDTDYDRILKNYRRCDSFIKVDNSAASALNIAAGKAFTSCKPQHGNRYVLPVFGRIPLIGKRILIDDCDRMYEPNEYSSANMKEIARIHEFSNKYNRTNIRVDSAEANDDVFTLRTSRTKYFYSLITNRALDFKIDGMSYRELYEEGPFVRALPESTLSNHLGFNGYIETNDGYFVFIYRHGKVSIGKNTLQNSVGASLKAEYALDENEKLTVKGIENAIINEIIDEVHLKNLDSFAERKDKIFSGFSFENSVLYFYRDLVEGGKPQLMFYTMIDISAAELRAAYTSGIKKDRKAKDEFGLTCAVDGYKMLLVKREEMAEIFMTPDCFVIRGTPYKAMPSAVATLQMMKEHMEETC